jgi:aspartate/methionine/tyrosine aminotransferase
VTPRTRICFVANPNNPTGSYVSSAELKRLRAGLPGNVLLVIDAAYAEYVDRPDYTAGAELVEEFGNVVMTRTFSKIFGLANLRIGWGYGPAHVIDTLNRVRGPFNLSTAALAAAEAAVDAMRQVRGVIMPFPGGIVRAGSKVGAKRYKNMIASTNEAYCPTARGRTGVVSELPADVNSVLEIVVDGLDRATIENAMHVGLDAACRPGVVQISAGNYGGKLGKHLFKLHDLL